MKDNRTSVKRSLLVSAIALTLTAALLIGTTFAWFTSTATTSVSNITAGSLGVEVVAEDGNNKVDSLAWQQPTGHETDPVLWEPGVTFNTVKFKIKNTGNLALKFKLQLGMNVTDANRDLYNAITFYIADTEDLDADGNPKKVDVDQYEGHLTGGDSSHTFYLVGTMDAAATQGMGQTLEQIGIAVVATQDTVEYDSNGKDYDANAQYPVVYPAGVSKATFTGNNTVVDANGNYYADVQSALASGEATTLYMKEDAAVTLQPHANVTNDVTIYANGADFAGKDISIGTYAAPANGKANVTIYNAKNLTVWGQPVDGRDDTWNVTMIGCENDNSNFVMYRGNETAIGKINVVLENCKATGYTDSIIHTTADGSIVIKNCEFTNNCAPVNIAHKQSGTMNVTVENCTFDKCGKVDTSNDYFAPLRLVNNSTTGTLKGTFKNNHFTNTIGTNGDILLGDYRTGKASHALTAKLVTPTAVMVKDSAEAPRQLSAGTYDLSVQ